MTAAAHALLDEAAARRHVGAPAWALFDWRVRTPRQARAPLPGIPDADPAAALSAALDAEATGTERVAYLHVPFCRTTCSFCGYCRQPLGGPGLVDGYLRAFRRQLAAFAPRRWTAARPFTALHFGGGTPTALPLDDLVALVREVAAALPLAPGAQVTVESTVSDAGAHTLEALLSAGVNRLALGVQTFDAARRRSLGRRASGEEALARIAQARAAGFGNVCVDLLYGLPGQTLESWRADLEALRGSGATGASVYPLVAFPSSSLGRSLMASGRDAACSLEEEHAFFRAADEALSAGRAWERFTPVQYGDRESGTARYVLAQATGADVLALGPGSGGSLGRTGYLNAPGVAGYVAAWEGGDAAPFAVEVADARLAPARPLQRLARTTRLDAGQASSALAGPFAEITSRLVDLDLAAATAEGGVQLTRDGCFWASNVELLYTLAARDGSPREGAGA